MNAVALDGIKALEPSARIRFLQDAIKHLNAEAEEVQKAIESYAIGETEKEMKRWKAAYEENAACFEAALKGDEITGDDLLFNYYSLPPMGQLRLLEVMKKSLVPCYGDEENPQFSKAAIELSHEINSKCKKPPEEI